MKIINVLEKPFFSSNDSQSDRKLIIMFHGYGADADNIIQLTNLFKVNNCIFIAPDAPNKCTTNPFEDSAPVVGRKWFDIDPNFDLNVLYERLHAIEKNIIDFIMLQLEKYNVQPENLILLGFSQGAMLAIHMALKMKIKIRSVIALCGFAVCPEKLENSIINKPEILLIYGKSDPIIPNMYFERSIEFFTTHDIPFQSRAFADLLHEIDHRVIEESEKFISDFAEN